MHGASFGARAEVVPMEDDEFLFGAASQDLEVRREVKVRIPVDYLLRLHGIKLVSGGGMSETVIKALDGYFAELARLGVHAAKHKAP